MAVGVVNSSVKSVEVFFPGTLNEIWYRFDKNQSNPDTYYGAELRRVDVDIKTVGKK